MATHLGAEADGLDACSPTAACPRDVYGDNEAFEWGETHCPFRVWQL